ncbi:MAG TPA: SAM-dependent methyltransferase [Allosphingosinicella sp.]|jgi:SAM-dependent MidA family methyltransferase
MHRSLSERLQRLIAHNGPICVAHYMAEANAHYYATRDPLGAAGDFTTAPEISQMFGELIGLCLADCWARGGRPDAAYVELGPGRGTLAADALRAMRAAGLTPQVHFVETSPILRKAQAERVPQARWHNDLSTLPDDRPLLVIANEFFDALPARQLIRTGRGWHERLVGHDGARFVPGAGPTVPDSAIPTHLRAASEGTILETSPPSLATMRLLASRLAAQGGAALIVDYGHDRSSAGETLQAVQAHGFADPWVEPGERDLTVHVDFEALGTAARESALQVQGPCGQGEFLIRLGIDARLTALSASAPERADEFRQARDRLVAPEQMGTLFRVLGLTAPAWPALEGFR